MQALAIKGVLFTFHCHQHLRQPKHLTQPQARGSFVPAASCPRICPSSDALAKSTEISRLAECVWRSRETSFGRARLSVGTPRARYHPSPDLHPWGNSVHGTKLSLRQCSLVTVQEALASLGWWSGGIEGSQRNGSRG